MLSGSDRLNPRESERGRREKRKESEGERGLERWNLRERVTERE